MSAAPLVSIAIATYNSEKYLAKTIQSCLDQTYIANMEIVVSDDNSSDSTIDIVKSFMVSPNPVRLIQHDRNRGFSKNISGAIKAGKGNFVIVLGHDDMLPPQHVERMLKWFTGDSIGLVHCAATQIDSEGNETPFPARKIETKIRQTKTPMKSLYVSNFIQSCGLMFRRSAFEAIGGWDESFVHGGEWDSYIRYAQKYNFAFATDTCGLYRVHATNITKKLDTEYQIEYQKYVQRCRDKAFALANLSAFELFCIKARSAHKKLRSFSRKLRGKA